MFARRLVLSLFLGAVLVGVTVGVAGAGGFKLPGFLGPFPPFLNTTLPADCQAHFNTDNTEVDCTASLPNPDPPKDTKTLKFDVTGPKGSCKVTLYPDGGVVEACRFKGELPV